MMLEAWMRGIIRLISENPAAVPVNHFVHHCLSHRHIVQ
jgi:hypothetical protein